MDAYKSYSQPLGYDGDSEFVHCVQCGKLAKALEADGLCGKCWYENRHPESRQPAKKIATPQVGW